MNEVESIDDCKFPALNEVHGEEEWVEQMPYVFIPEDLTSIQRERNLLTNPQDHKLPGPINCKNEESNKELHQLYDKIAKIREIKTPTAEDEKMINELCKKKDELTLEFMKLFKEYK